MDSLNRREFITMTGAGLAGAAALTKAHPASAAPSDKVIVGVMGMQRGLAVAKDFIKVPNVEIRYVCDVDSTRAEKAAGELEKLGIARPKTIGDYRTILDDAEVDALVCAAPNHWHGPATIAACSAGKHVYVEKPCSHNPREAEWMVEAANKHNRIVQVGTQRRSSVPTRTVIGMLHEGKIGRVYSARATYASARGSIGSGKTITAPADLDYDLWQGPAARAPYTDNRIHYNWHWFWNWGNGDLGNNGVHAIDLCRWGLQVDFPKQVTSCGGRYCFDDDQETADTHTVAFSFDEEKLITWDGHSCNPHAAPFVSFYGEKGAIDLYGNGTYRVFDAKAKPIGEGKSVDIGMVAHLTNFVKAIRADDAKLLNCGIQEAYISTQLCHLGNIAHRTGRALNCSTIDGRILNDDEAMGYWERDYEPGWNPTIG